MTDAARQRRPAEPCGRDVKQLAGLALFVPLALAAGAFTVENLQPVAVSFWPLPAGIEVPVSVWTFSALAAGTLLGIAVGWLAGGRWRRRARRAERRLRRLERETEAAPGASPAAGRETRVPPGRAADG